jgi:hypothetical protein
MEAPPVLPSEVRNAISSLFISSAGDPAQYAVLVAHLPLDSLRAELAKRDLRGRLFVHLHSLSSSRSAAPEAALSLLTLVAAACRRSKVCAAQMASDVGVRPLVALLARARAAPGPVLHEAAAVACGLLGLVVAHNSKSSLLMRLESGVDAVCGLLAPLPHGCPALLVAGAALLRTLCSDSEPNVRLAHRRGMLAVLADAMEGLLAPAPAPEQPQALLPHQLALARLLAVLLAVPPAAPPPAEGPGSPAALVALAARLLRPPYDAPSARDAAAAGLAGPS